jgi:hypothetical protein
MTTTRVACFSLLALLLQNAHATCMGLQNTSIPISTPTSSFSVSADGTVLAPRRKLMWMRCLVGQTLTNGVCTGTASLFTWADALNAAKAQTFAGHNDWRVPNVKELLSIVEDRCSAPGLNADLFPISGFLVWSSTPKAQAAILADELVEAWQVNDSGLVSRNYPNQPLSILLVRDMP